MNSARGSGIGVSLVLIAVGAVLYFAVTTTVSGISLDSVGVILMIVGALGFVASLALGATTTRAADDRTTVIQNPPVVERRTTVIEDGRR